MSVLNRPSDGLLSVLLALRRTLIAYGPVSEDHLLAFCAPASVVPDGKPDMARRTLTRWKQLGFFRENGEVIELSPDLASVNADDTDSLRAGVLRMVLAPENNPLFADHDRSEDNEKSKASDCTFAAAWALLQDPYAFPARYRGGVESLQASQGVEPPPFANDTRWAGFVEWSSFLGITWSATKAGLVLDPAFAVRVFLDDVYGRLSELPQETFFGHLAEALPIVDGGRYQLAVQGRTAKPVRTARANHVSPCLSVGMLTLEAKGVIRLESRSDAANRILLGRAGRELRPVSHVIRLGDA